MATKYLLSQNSVAKLKTLFAGSGAVSSRLAQSAVAALDADFPYPFEVRYAASASGGDDAETGGAWIMWLGGGQLLSVNGEIIEASVVQGDLAQVGSPYPEGWVSLKGVMPETGGQLWMRVIVPKSDADSSSAASASSPSVEWIVGDTAGDAQDDAELFAVPIALTSRDTSTGAATVNQQTVGAVRIDGGSSSISSGVVKSGADSNVVGTIDIASGVLTLTLDVYYK